MRIARGTGRAGHRRVRGIGRPSPNWGAAGATVVGTATTESGAADIQARARRRRASGPRLALDVTDAAACEARSARSRRAGGAVGILVNNAGITRDNLAMRMKDDEWDAVLDTNPKAVFRMSKAGHARHDEGPHGRIINITSVVGSSGNPGQANYAPPRPAWPA